DYKIPLHDVKDLLEVDRRLQIEQEKEKARFYKLKIEVEEIRQERRKHKKPRIKKIRKQNSIAPKLSNHFNKNASKLIELEDGINFDRIYKPWMAHVGTKSTSKSYWYIHEYIARYILNYAIENGAKSINKQIVQEFLDDYGKGRAAKTMNHYNRVAKYFLEFCDNL
ncbi:MAG: hypothetical protein ACW99Q_12660, partial [Candidatus Kariarchaeaceae archaeon]